MDKVATRTFLRTKIEKQLVDYHVTEESIHNILSFFVDRFQKEGLDSSFLSVVSISTEERTTHKEIQVSTKKHSWEFDWNGHFISYDGLTQQEFLYENFDESLIIPNYEE